MTPSEIKSLFKVKLKKLKEIAKTGEINLDNTNTLEVLLDKDFFDIAFIGEFTSGKSTMINALLGEDILPTKLEPTTARITYIIYSEQPYVLLTLLDGSKKYLSYSENVLKDLIASNYDEINQVNNIEVGYPSDILKNGIRFIDTPGTNDINQHRVELTYNLLPSVDVVIYITISPLTLSNLNFLREYVIGSGIKNVFFILNKIDLFNTDINKSKAIEGVKNIIQQEIKKEIKLYAVSAIDYLEGKINKDNDLILLSNFNQFTKELSEYLQSSDKYNGTIAQLEFNYAKIKNDLINFLQIKLSGLTMSDEVFTEKNKVLIKDLEEYRKLSIDVKRDVEKEYYRLTNKLSSSLSNLNEEMIDRLESTLSQSSGDTKLILRNIESSIKKQFENWITRNEPIIEEYFQTLKFEIEKRLNHIIENISTSLKIYNTNIINTNSLEKPNGKSVENIMSDEHKARTVVTLGSAAIYGTMAMFHIAIAPLAAIIAPIGMYLLQKKKEEERNILKKQLLAEFEINSKKFNQEVINQINKKKKDLIDVIDELVDSFTNRIEKEILIVEKEKIKLKDELTLRIKNIEDAFKRLSEN